MVTVTIDGVRQFGSKSRVYEIVVRTTHKENQLSSAVCRVRDTEIEPLMSLWGINDPGYLYQKTWEVPDEYYVPEDALSLAIVRGRNNGIYEPKSVKEVFVCVVCALAQGKLPNVLLLDDVSLYNFVYSNLDGGKVRKEFWQKLRDGVRRKSNGAVRLHLLPQEERNSLHFLLKTPSTVHHVVFGPYTDMFYTVSKKATKVLSKVS